MNVESPCVNICKLNADNVCIGCLRTLGEIQSWPLLTESDKELIIKQIEETE